MNERSIIPGPAEAPYSSVIRVRDTIYVAGIIGQDPANGQLAGEILAETEQCLRNLSAELKQVDCSLSDLVATTVYLTNFDRDYKSYNEVWRRYFSANPPTRATVEVKSLALGALIEIQSIAVI